MHKANSWPVIASPHIWSSPRSSSNFSKGNLSESFIGLQASEGNKKDQSGVNVATIDSSSFRAPTVAR